MPDKPTIIPVMRVGDLLKKKDIGMTPDEAEAMGAPAEAVETARLMLAEKPKRRRGVEAEPVSIEFGGCVFTFHEVHDDDDILSKIAIDITTGLRSGAWAARISAAYMPHKEDSGIKVTVRVK